MRPLKRVVLGRSMARPTPAISVDTNGDFADRKAEVSSSAMHIVRSFGDLTRADSIINCAGARLPMPSNPDEPPHQLRRTPVAVRIGRMQESAEMGYTIICKSCSNSTLNLQLALEARISRHLSLRGRGMRGKLVTATCSYSMVYAS